MSTCIPNNLEDGCTSMIRTRLEMLWPTELCFFSKQCSSHNDRVFNSGFRIFSEQIVNDHIRNYRGPKVFLHVICFGHVLDQLNNIGYKMLHTKLWYLNCLPNIWHDVRNVWCVGPELYPIWWGSYQLGACENQESFVRGSKEFFVIFFTSVHQYSLENLYPADKARHHRPASETQFSMRFDSGPMMAWFFQGDRTHSSPLWIHACGGRYPVHTSWKCPVAYLQHNMSRDMWFQTMWHFDSVDSDEPVQPPFKLRNSK